MSFGGGYEKSVKGGTKSKLAAPKSKYVQHLLEATTAGDVGIGEVFRSIQFRLKEPTWTVVFKSLIITHMLIREGHKDAVLDYLANSHQFRITALTSTGCSPMSEQGQNIADYGAYLTARVKAFGLIKTDYVKVKSDSAGQGRLRKLSVDKGLLRETESVQKLIAPLIKCKLLEKEVDNEITLTAFRLLVADLLVLFQVANEGVINVLEHYFEMSRPDAERALKIYKRFVDQTDGVIVYMSLARSLESVTRLEIPNLQHAPTSLGNSLEEYINDPDFEQNRIQYLAQKTGGGAKSKPEGTNGANLRSALKKGNETNPFGAAPSQGAGSANSDLLDFFGSIEPQQQESPQYPSSVAQNGYLQQAQATGTNPYLNAQAQAQAQMTGVQQAPLTTQYTAAQQNFSGQQQQPNSQYPQAPQQAQMPAPLPQQQVYQQYPQQQPQQIQPQPQYFQQQPTGHNPYGNVQQQQTSGAYGAQPTMTSSSQFQTSSLQPQATGSNPFRKSMMPVMGGSNEFGAMSPQMTGGNPFSRAPPSNGTPLFSAPSSSQYPPQQMQAQTTGNPFSKNRVVSDSVHGTQQQAPMQMNMTGSLMPQQTGGNPFRKSMMPMSPPQQQYSFGGR